MADKEVSSVVLDWDFSDNDAWLAVVTHPAGRRCSVLDDPAFPGYADEMYTVMEFKGDVSGAVADGTEVIRLECRCHDNREE